MFTLAVNSPGFRGMGVRSMTKRGGMTLTAIVCDVKGYEPGPFGHRQSEGVLVSWC